MESYSNNYQLVLFDGDNNRINLINHFKQLVQIPLNCRFIIFYNQSNRIEEDILYELNHIPQIELQKCVDPSDKLLNTLYNNIIDYSCVHVICDVKPKYMHDLLKIHEKHKNIYVMGMSRSDINANDIIYHLEQYTDGISNLSTIINTKLLFDNYQCPRCSKSFKLQQNLEQHYKENHISITTIDVDIDPYD